MASADPARIRSNMEAIARNTAYLKATGEVMSVTEEIDLLRAQRSLQQAHEADRERCRKNSACPGGSLRTYSIRLLHSALVPGPRGLLNTPARVAVRGDLG
jgi:hypothetical protein